MHKNAELYKHLLAWARGENFLVELEDAGWNQQHWAIDGKRARGSLDQQPLTCGTGCCIAGAAVIASGGKIIMPEHSTTAAAYCQMPGNENVQEIEVAAAGLLGLEGYEQDYVFAASNGLADLEDYLPYFEEDRPIG